MALKFAADGAPSKKSESELADRYSTLVENSDGTLDLAHRPATPQEAAAARRAIRSGVAWQINESARVRVEQVDRLLAEEISSQREVRRRARQNPVRIRVPHLRGRGRARRPGGAQRRRTTSTAPPGESDDGEPAEGRQPDQQLAPIPRASAVLAFSLLDAKARGGEGEVES